MKLYHTFLLASFAAVAAVGEVCSDFSDCYSCVKDKASGGAGCGWCESSSSCLFGTTSGPLTGSCSSGWDWTSSFCPGPAPSSPTPIPVPVDPPFKKINRESPVWEGGSVNHGAGNEFNNGFRMETVGGPLTPYLRWNTTFYDNKEPGSRSSGTTLKGFASFDKYLVYSVCYQPSSGFLSRRRGGAEARFSSSSGQQEGQGSNYYIITVDADTGKTYKTLLYDMKDPFNTCSSSLSSPTIDQNRGVAFVTFNPGLDQNYNYKDSRVFAVNLPSAGNGYQQSIRWTILAADVGGDPVSSFWFHPIYRPPPADDVVLMSNAYFAAVDASTGSQRVIFNQTLSWTGGDDSLTKLSSGNGVWLMNSPSNYSFLDFNYGAEIWRQPIPNDQNYGIGLSSGPAAVPGSGSKENYFYTINSNEYSGYLQKQQVNFTGYSTLWKTELDFNSVPFSKMIVDGSSSSVILVNNTVQNGGLNNQILVQEYDGETGNLTSTYNLPGGEKCAIDNFFATTDYFFASCNIRNTRKQTSEVQRVAIWSRKTHEQVDTAYLNWQISTTLEPHYTEYQSVWICVRGGWLFVSAGHGYAGSAAQGDYGFALGVQLL